MAPDKRRRRDPRLMTIEQYAEHRLAAGLPGDLAEVQRLERVGMVRRRCDCHLYQCPASCENGRVYQPDEDHRWALRDAARPVRRPVAPTPRGRR